MSRQLQGIIISDFNTDVLSGYLNNLTNEPSCLIKPLPFGEVHQVLGDPAHPAWSTSPDFMVFWSQALSVLPALSKHRQDQGASLDLLERDVRLLAQHLKGRALNVKHVIICLFTLGPNERGLGVRDYSSAGMRFWVHKANDILISALSDVPNIIFRDPDHWCQAVGPSAHSRKMWYVSKMPYSMDVFKKAAMDIKESLAVLQGQTKKLIFLDLDNTLWGGELGDAGRNNLKLGGHDPVGEAFGDFQRQLKILKNRGIVLAIVSKNDETTALDAIDHHPEMVLRKTDFAAWRINWADKAQNIVDILKELNLPPSAAVYIDDNPSEQDRVRKSIEGITVPSWPSDVFMYVPSLMAMPYFDPLQVTQEDLRRTAMYQAESQRQALKQPAVSVQDWLKSLSIVLTIERLDETNLSRAVQLLNKTNQMNLSTRRMSEVEYWLWAKQAGRHVRVFRVKDDLGDSGLIGLLSLSVLPTHVQLIDFILSCRVFGRNIEDAMLSKAISIARLEQQQLKAKVIPTEKNKPCMDFFMRSGLIDRGDYCFEQTPANEHSFPEVLAIVDNS